MAFTRVLPTQNPVRGFLASVGINPPILVKFQYNPTQLGDKRSVNYATINAPGLLMPIRQYSQGGDRTLSFTVRVDGLFKGPADDEIPISKAPNGSITPELNKYRAFLYPAPYPRTSRARWQEAQGSFVTPYPHLQQFTQKTIQQFQSMQQFTSPPTCLFGFGRDRVIHCVVTEVSINEVLFNPELQPLRADISITLVELMPYGDEGTLPTGVF